MNTIDKIRAEIERLYDGEAPKHAQQCDFDDGYFTGIGAISKFLDTLESEKPMQEGLEEEIDACWQSWLSPSNQKEVEEVLPKTEFAMYARHFAQWGAEHRDSSEIPNDPEEAAAQYARDYTENDEGNGGDDWEDDIRITFIAGAKWQADHTPLPEDTVLFNNGVEEGKRLMMEEAVEADVNIYRDLAEGESWAEFVVAKPPKNLGDKVRIIVCKNEDKK